MARILVAGLINIETTLRISGFPLEYNPVNYPFFGVGAMVSGVGYNVAHALTRLGHQVHLLALVGDDFAAGLARAALRAAGMDDSGVLSLLPQTPQSVILYDPQGRRQIHTDLKDIQERTYPPDTFAAALADADLCVLCNINFARPWLSAARAAGKPIASDVHTVSDLDDPYNGDWLRAADILFMSDERLPLPPTAWAEQVMARCAPATLVIGMGSRGALLAERDSGLRLHLPAVTLRPIVSTIGAGDALFAAYVDGALRHLDAAAALRRAMRYAAWKIGVASASEGHLTAEELEQLGGERGGA